MDTNVNSIIEYVQKRSRSIQRNEVAHECKRRVLDSFACAIAGHDEHIGKLSINAAARYSGECLATIWGTSKRSSVDMATFANGTLLRCLDLSDMYRTKSGGHPSDVIAPIVSVAECFDVSGSKTLVAIEIAYEIYCGFCDSIDVNSLGWDQPIYCAAATSLGASALLGLDSNQMKNALSLALVPNMALYQTRTGELSAWKGCAAANGSRNAVFAALLARDGFTGPEHPIEGEMGMHKILGKFKWEVPGLHDDPAVCRTHFKSFPICYHGQAAAWAAIDIFSMKISIEEIKDIQVFTYYTAVKLMGADPSRWTPNTRETADHSLPYVIAIALLYGSIDEKSFQDDMLSNPRILLLMKKIKVVEDPKMTDRYPDEVPCRISIKMNDGSFLESDITYPKGHEKNRFSDDELMSKVNPLFESRLGVLRGREVIDAVWSIDKSESIRPIVRMLEIEA